MFTALTGEFRVLLQTVIDNQHEMANEMKRQNDRIEELNTGLVGLNTGLEMLHVKLMSGMKTLHTAFAQIKTVAEFFEDSMCEGLGKMSQMNMGNEFM